MHSLPHLRSQWSLTGPCSGSVVPEGSSERDSTRLDFVVTAAYFRGDTGGGGQASSKNPEGLSQRG